MASERIIRQPYMPLSEFVEAVGAAQYPREWSRSDLVSYEKKAETPGYERAECVIEQVREGLHSGIITAAALAPSGVLYPIRKEYWRCEMTNECLGGREQISFCRSDAVFLKSHLTYEVKRQITANTYIEGDDPLWGYDFPRRMEVFVLNWDQVLPRNSAASAPVPPIRPHRSGRTHNWFEVAAAAWRFVAICPPPVQDGRISRGYKADLERHLLRYFADNAQDEPSQADLRACIGKILEEFLSLGEGGFPSEQIPRLLPARIGRLPDDETPPKA